MKQNQSLGRLSDGNLYEVDDHVAADTGGCNGCNVCCHDIGDLVVLTPFDIYEMKRCLKLSFEELLKEHVWLRNTGKIVLPYLKMKGEDKACSFLSEQGRCTIHGYRPGICRLFPLGRLYETDDFKYFLQINSCVKRDLKEVKIREWLGIQDYDENKAFLICWHQMIKALGFRLKFVRDEKELAEINRTLLELFYIRDFTSEDNFYDVFFKEVGAAKNKLGIL